MPEPQPIPLDFDPGIQRDGTRFDTNRCLDALWTRWRIGRPRSIRGFAARTDRLNGIGRKIFPYYTGDQIILHVGTAVGIQQIVLDGNANLISVSDRTPQNFTPGINVGWTLDAVFDTTSNIVQLCAHAVSDLSVLSSDARLPIFLGQIDAQTPLVTPSNPNPPTGVWAQPLLAGGIVVVQPYLFGFDSNGGISWSAPNSPETLGVTAGSTGAGAARESAQKIVAGIALRGGGVQSPAALFWSLSEVITATFVGGGPIFAFNTLSTSTSILSSDCVIEYDGLYFWAGVDRFMVFNGTVVEIPNSQNQDWFFDNMNWTFAAKSFAFKVPRYGEIWFCAPLFGNTEPSHAVIYNVRENYWYDTVLPNGGRSSGYHAQGFRNPFMCGVQNEGAGYMLWEHEVGADQINLDGSATMIRKYFETPFIGGPKNNPPVNEGLSVEQFEFDAVQTGDMSAYALLSANSRSAENPGIPVPIKAIPAIPQDQIPGMKQSSRLMRFHIESNTVGGSYESGRILAHAQKAKDARITQ